MASSSPSVEVPTKRVFGLGIDEKIQWVVADVPGARASLSDRMVCGTFNIDFAGSSHPRINLDEELHNAIGKLQQQRPELFTDVASVGVSAIGVITSNSIRGLARKNLFRRNNFPVVDFEELFRGFFDADVVKHLNVLNDASAKALVEHNLGMEATSSKMESTLYLMFHEGVNGGIVFGEKVLSSSLHPEMGHIRPRLHERDLDFSSDEGKKSCPVHGSCYEAIASGARIRHSWGGTNPRPDFNISDLPLNHEAWEIISDYISQLCMVGTLVLAPKSIILGGSVTTGRDGDERSYQRVRKKLWPLIIKKYKILNTKYLFYGEMEHENFIRPAQLINNANIMAALQTARLGAFPEQLVRKVNEWPDLKLVVDNVKNS